MHAKLGSSFGQIKLIYEIILVVYICIPAPFFACQCNTLNFSCWNGTFLSGGISTLIPSCRRYSSASVLSFLGIKRAVKRLKQSFQILTPADCFSSSRDDHICCPAAWLSCKCDCQWRLHFQLSVGSHPSRTMEYNITCV